MYKQAKDAVHFEWNEHKALMNSWEISWCTMNRAHCKGKPGSLVISLGVFLTLFSKVTVLQLCSQWGTASEGENRKGILPAFC